MFSFRLYVLKKVAKNQGVTVEQYHGELVLRENNTVFGHAVKTDNGFFIYDFVTPSSPSQRNVAERARLQGFVANELPADKTYVSPNGRVWANLFVGRYDTPEIEYISLKAGN